jgi:CRISPR-associated protein Cas4
MNEILDTSHYLRINEIKNHLYCPRIPYYALCLRIDRETGLSHAGIEAEAEVKGKLERRRHALHAVVDGKRDFDVMLTSHVYQLIGKLDEVVWAADGFYLVDYKDTDHDHGYWRIQMGAYLLCALESDLQPIISCYVYSIPTQEYHAIKVSERDLAQLRTTIIELQTMLGTEICPPATKQFGKCRTCQYARFCNDVF